MRKSILIFSIVVMIVCALGGCGVTERRTIVNGRDPDQLWEAMKAVAQEPDYYMSSTDVGERWIVRANDVAFDDDARRIEVFRELEREIHQPMAPVKREERQWKFEIALEAPAEGAAAAGGPVMRFRTRNAGVPAHAWQEAQRYFDEVERFLGPLPASEVTRQPAIAPTSNDAPAP